MEIDANFSAKARAIQVKRKNNPLILYGILGV
ncbi:hypothetical protein CF65_01450 [Aggregatibacter actinomycetemcomitans HK1651]|nr:hypothetical protein CF65_01450 [Aggregatibacter actinomycetemcomitans HK1651]